MNPSLFSLYSSQQLYLLTHFCYFFPYTLITLLSPKKHKPCPYKILNSSNTIHRLVLTTFLVDLFGLCSTQSLISEDYQQDLFSDCIFTSTYQQAARSCCSLGESGLRVKGQNTCNREGASTATAQPRSTQQGKQGRPKDPQQGQPRVQTTIQACVVDEADPRSISPQAGVRRCNCHTGPQ